MRPSATPRPRPEGAAAATFSGPGSAAGPASGACAAPGAPPHPAPSRSTTAAPMIPATPATSPPTPITDPSRPRRHHARRAGPVLRHLRLRPRPRQPPRHVAPRHDADRAEAQARQAARLRTELARIDAAEGGLISELEQPADASDPAAQAHRARIRERFTEPYAQRTATEAKLTELQNAAPDDNDPSLLDALPVAAGSWTEHPPGSRKPCWPRSRSRPSTTRTTTTRSPSAPPSPTTHPAPSPPCSPTPAPTTTAPSTPQPATTPCHIWDPPLLRRFRSTIMRGPPRPAAAGAAAEGWVGGGGGREERDSPPHARTGAATAEMIRVATGRAIWRGGW